MLIVMAGARELLIFPFGQGSRGPAVLTGKVFATRVECGLPWHLTVASVKLPSCSLSCRRIKLIVKLVVVQCSRHLLWLMNSRMLCTC